MSGYAVVVFNDDQKGDTVAVVPVNWIDGDEAYWAPYGNQQAFDRSVTASEKPRKTWNKYPCRILGIKDSYAKAREQLRLAEDTSDIASDVENRPRKPRPPKRLESETDDELGIPEKRHRVKISSRTPLVEFKQQQTDGKKSSKLLPTPPTPPPVPVLTNPTLLDLPQPEVIPSNSMAAEPDDMESADSIMEQSITATSTPSRQATIDAETHVTQPQSNVASRANQVMLKILVELKADMRQVKSQINDLKDVLRDVRAASLLSTVDGDENDGKLVLPMNEYAQVEALEEQLFHDKSVKRQLLHRLARCGGKTVRKAVGRMIDTLLVNSLQREFNWTGVSGKKSFKNLECCDILYEAVRLNLKTKSATDYDIKADVQWYLHGAMDRCGGKMKRMKKAKLLSLVEEPEQID